jgi:hypothetical protein
MERRFEELQARVEELARELRELGRRFDRLDEQRASDSAEDGAAAVDEMAADNLGRTPAFARISPARVVALVGRTLVILGGGYLFRALTDAALVPPLVGVVAGLLYGTWWLLAADRAAFAGDRLSASFFGLVAAMIVCPLVWETTARFELLFPAVAAGTLVIFLGFGLAVTWRRDLEAVAWIMVLFAVATMFGLLISTREWLLFSIGMLALAATVEVLAVNDRWLGLRWPVALGADLSLLLLFSIALRKGEPPDGAELLSPGWVIGVGVALPILYLATIAFRTLVRERTVAPFAVAQAAVALLIGFGGATRVVVFNGASPAALGIAGIVLGAACYTAAFAVVDQRLGRGANFYSYSSFAGLLILAGSSMILPPNALALVWSGLAIAAMWLGGHFDRITLRFHGAAYLTMATIVCGLVVLAWAGLTADPAGVPWHATPACLLVAVAAAVCYAMLVAMPTAQPSQLANMLPQAMCAALIALSVAGLAAGWLVGPLLATDTVAGPAFVAAGRTAIIAVLAVALAWAARRWSLQELGWLVYPLLVGGGIKLLWEDFGYAHPVALFVTLAFYGSALIVTPRLMRKAR